MKKIVSTALVAVLLVTSLFAALPLQTFAAYSEYTHTTMDAATAQMAQDAVTQISNRYNGKVYATAEEMLTEEKNNGYLDSCQVTTEGGEVFTLYVNRYTGMMYYVNGATGQILTSNPYDLSNVSISGNLDDNGYVQQLKSQILLDYAENTKMDEKSSMSSYKDAVSRYQISVTPIAQGLRINYTLGDTSRRPLFPYGITYEDYRTKFLDPVYNELMELIEANVDPDKYPRSKYDYFDESNYDQKYGKNDMFVAGTASNGEPVYNHAAFKDFTATSSSGAGMFGQTQELGAIADIIKKGIANEEIRTEAQALLADVNNLVSRYTMKNPYEYHETSDTLGVLHDSLSEMYKDYPITKGESDEDFAFDDDVIIMVISSTKIEGKTKNYIKQASALIRKYCPEYTFTDMYNAEEMCNIVVKEEEKPVFRCALEYRLDKDGTLLVTLPASSISYDASKYTLKSISVLPYFGAGDATDEDGYAFYPDGSGSVIAFKDFYNDLVKRNISISSSIYGEDYCYSNISGKKKEQVTMPVYGVVGNVPANQTTKDAYGVSEVTNGFFCIMEEGASLSTFNVALQQSLAYLGAYSSYTPYAIDSFDLSALISTATATEYFIASEVPYSGNYTQRYVMLRDPAINPTQDAYISSYIGMANYYRDYLKKSGVIDAIAEADMTEQMPLYIETMGSMEIDDTFLTFPIKRDIALTSFEDVQTMYKELSQKGIKNVNFRLTAYANGGMYAKYPVKLRWEKVCGGKSGFRDLLAYAEGLSKENGEVLGLYPEFDFMYIKYTSLFDGIGKKNNVSRMLDNRYAVQRIWDSTLGEVTDSFSSVIAAESLDKLYEKFNKKYSDYGATGLSVSTMGSDLSSNFDETATVSREQEMKYVQNVLAGMSEQYELMMDKGNAYALQYAKHLLNVSTDSSHSRNTSYTVPFLGMILHGYVNYAGTPLNNSGAPKYDLLRSIENGASLYYILCYQNIEYMKTNEVTNEYYSVDYKNWFDAMVENYNKVNDAIGGELQSYRISDHKLLIGERMVSESERCEVYQILTDEYLDMIETQLRAAADREIALLQISGDTRSLGMSVDRTALKTQFINDLMMDAGNQRYVLPETFKAELISRFESALDEIASAMEEEYPTGASTADFTFDSIDYQPSTNYLTASTATDGNAYETTLFTNDNGNIVLVTYSDDEGHARSFLLNYNIFAVTVTIGTTTYTLGEYDFVAIEGGV